MYKRNRFAELLFTLGIVLGATSLVSGYQDSAEESFALAANHYSLGDYARAEVGFASTANQFPDAQQALLCEFFRGECLVQLNRFDESTKHFQAFVADPTSQTRSDTKLYFAQALYRAGETAFLSGNITLAKEFLTRFVADYPNHELGAFALPYLGDIHFEAAEYTTAITQYETCLQRFSPSVLEEHCRLALGLCYVQLDRSSDATRFLQAVIAMQGVHASQAQYELARVYHDSQNYRLSADLCADYLELYPSGRERIDCYYLLASSQLDLSHPQAAKLLIQRLDAERLQLLQSEDLESRQRANTFHPETAITVRFRLAQKLFDSDDVIGSTGLFQSIIDSWPTSDLSDDAFEFLVRIAKQTQDPKRVETLAETFCSEYPESAFITIVADTAGRSAYENQQFATAQSWFAKAIQNVERRPSIEAVDIAKLHYMEGLAWIGMKRFSTAANSLQTGATLLDEARPIGNLQDAPDALNAAFQLGLATAHDGLNDLNASIEHRVAYLSLDTKTNVAARCYADLVVCYLKLDDLDAADATLTDLTKHFPQHPQRLKLMRLLAESSYQASYWPLATEYFAELAVESPTSKEKAAAESGLAWVHYKLDDGPLAAMTFLEVIRLEETGPLAAEAWYMMGRIAQEQDSPEQAIGCYSQVGWCDPQSPFKWDSILREANIRKQIGTPKQLESALELLDMALTDSDEKHVDRLLFETAMLDQMLGNTDSSAQRFERLLTAYPESELWSEAAYQFANALSAQEEMSDADAWLRQILERENVENLHSYATFKLGHHAVLRSDWLSVRELMNQVTESADPELAIASTYWLAESNFRLADYDKAKAYFEGLLDDGKSKQEWRPTIRLRLAQINAVREDWGLSLKEALALEPLREQIPNDYELDYLTGRCFSALGRFSEARGAFAKVLRSPIGGKSETAAKAQWMIGESYFHQRDFEKAIDAYLRVDVLFPYASWKAAALLQAAKCHDQAGRPDQASRLLAKLLKEHPNSEFAAEASRRLQTTQANSSTEKLR